MKKEIRIALVALVALVALFFGLNFLKGSRLFANDNDYFLAFRNVAGVAKNCPIYADGIVVGTVGAITYDYSHLSPTLIHALLDKKMVIPAGTQAEIKTDLMGNTQINLLLGTEIDRPLAPGDTIYGKEDDGLLTQAAALLPTVDSILVAVHSVVSDPALHSMLANVDVLSAQLVTSAAQLDALLAQLAAAVPPLVASTNSLVSDADSVAAHLAAAEIEETVADLRTTIGELQTTVALLNSTDGTLGKLLGDSTLYNNLANTVADADSLVVDLKAHPKRYVHFSVFGKKN